MNITTAKTISLNQLLAQLGYEPTRQSDSHETWYHSPFREERTASFKVKNDRVFYDHGEGFGGTVIDFGLRYRRTDSVKEVLAWLSQFEHLSQRQAQQQTRIRAVETQKITVTNVGQLSRHSLIHYLRDIRKVDPLIARHHVREIDYQIKDRPYFALGFANQSGGWELRNPFIQLATSPKDVSMITAPHNPQHRVAVFEGFMDFLSVLTQKQSTTLSQDVVVLNSLALQERAITILNERGYTEIDSYMDNDEAGRKATERFERMDISVRPQNHLYASFKDVNEAHVASYHRGNARS